MAVKMPFLIERKLRRQLLSVSVLLVAGVTVDDLTL